MSDSPVPPSYDPDEPVTGIHDIPRGMREWAASYARRVKSLGRRFDELDRKLDRFLTKHETERGIVKSLPTWLAVIALVLTWAGGAVALYVHAQQPPPQQPSAEEIAKKLIKLQSQQH